MQKPHLDVEGRAHHLAILYELRNNRAHNVNGDGKTDSSRGACVSEDGSVDPNHPSLSHKPWCEATLISSSRKGKEKSAPFGVDSMRNQVLHRAAQDQQLNLHCLTGSVKQQAQYSRREQMRDCCQHSIGVLRTHSVPTMQSMVSVSIVQEQQSIQMLFYWS